MKNFNGEQLKKARIYRGYTVGELAELSGYQRQTISMYENKKRMKKLDTKMQR